MNITDHIIKDPTGWDEAGDFGDLQLYNGTLQVDTLYFKKGDKIPCATFLLTQSVLQLYDKEGDKVEELDLVLSVKFKERQDHMIA